MERHVLREIKRLSERPAEPSRAGTTTYEQDQAPLS